MASVKAKSIRYSQTDIPYASALQLVPVPMREDYEAMMPYYWMYLAAYAAANANYPVGDQELFDKFFNFMGFCEDKIDNYGRKLKLRTFPVIRRPPTDNLPEPADEEEQEDDVVVQVASLERLGPP